MFYNTVDNTPKELKAVDAPFAELSGTLDLADLTAYSDANAITVTGVSGALSVSGANAQIDKVDAFITTASGKVTKESGVTSTVDVYLGGSKTAVGTDPLDFSGESNAVASSADKVYLNTTGLLTIKDATNFGTKLDLSKVENGQVTISDEVKATSGDGTSVDTTYFAANGVQSGDTITFTAAHASSANDADKVVGTIGKDIITLASSITGTNAFTIDLGNDTAADKLDASAVAAVSSSDQLPTKMLSVENAKAGDQIKLEATATVAVEGVVKKTFDSDSSKSYVDAIKAAFTSENKGKAFLIEAKDTKVSGAQETKYYLAVDNGTTGLATGDKIIELVGVTDTLKLNTTITDNFITLA